MARTIEELRAAVEKYNELSADQEVVRIADAELFARLDKKQELLEAEEEGEKRGERRGEKRKSQSIAVKMLENGVEIEDIIKYTGLTKAEIERLRVTA